MTPQQRWLVRDSFELLHGMMLPVTQLFYGRLFDLDPSLRALFKTDLKTQSRKLGDTLATAASSLSDFERIKPQLRELGTKHAGYGVLPAHYDTVTAALLWALGQALQQDFTPDVREAWRAMLNAVNAEMISGHESQVVPSNAIDDDH